MVNFLMGFAEDAEAERGDVAVITQDGQTLLVQPVPGGGGGNAGQVLIFPTIAAMSAFNVATPAVLASGTDASVQSNGSFWSLVPNTEALAPDGITVASATGDATRVWLRTNLNTKLAQWLLEPGWHIDPSNVTGVANDENPGSAAAPLRTAAEVYRRWGYTWSPDLTVNCVVTMMSAPAGTADPLLFAPNLLEGSQFTITAALPAPSFTGTLNVVTPKNRVARTPLKATFNTVTGAMATGLMLVNATRGNSVAFSFSGGPNFLLTQPCAPYAGGDATILTEVDTWAGGDEIAGYALLQVDVARCAGYAEILGVPPNFICSRIAIVDPSANFSPLQIDGPANVAIIESFVETRSPSVTSTFDFTTFSNSLCLPVITSSSQSPVNFSYRAGGFGSSGIVCAGQGVTLANDVICGGDVLGDAILCTTAYVDATFGLLPTGGLSSIALAYGPGNINVQAGTCLYSAPATASLNLAAGIQISGSANAYSHVTPGGPGTATTVNLVAITAAALDAAAGAAGFGGLASVGGATLTTGGVAP